MVNLLENRIEACKFLKILNRDAKKITCSVKIFVLADKSWKMYNMETKNQDKFTGDEVTRYDKK